MFGPGRPCKWCGDIRGGCTDTCSRCSVRGRNWIQVHQKRLDSRRPPTTMEDALDTDPTREVYLRPDLLQVFRDAYMLVEERLLALVENHRIFGIKNDLLGQLKDAAAFVRSGGKDAKLMFECQSWHLFMYLARVLEPDSPHFAWYPGHQPIMEFEGVISDLIHEICDNEDPNFVRSAKILNDKDHELYMGCWDEIRYRTMRNASWLTRQAEVPDGINDEDG